MDGGRAKAKGEAVDEDEMGEEGVKRVSPGTVDDLRNRGREGEAGERVSDVVHVERYMGCRGVVHDNGGTQPYC